jgi:hypothetical protein
MSPDPNDITDSIIKELRSLAETREFEAVIDELADDPVDRESPEEIRDFTADIDRFWAEQKPLDTTESVVDDQPSENANPSSGQGEIVVKHEITVKVSPAENVADEIAALIAPIVQEMHETILAQVKEMVDQQAVVLDRRHTF